MSGCQRALSKLHHIYVLSDYQCSVLYLVLYYSYLLSRPLAAINWRGERACD